MSFATLQTPQPPNKDKLEVSQQQSQEFYRMCAKGEFNKITKKHSFRSFVNQDRS